MNSGRKQREREKSLVKKTAVRARCTLCIQAGSIPHLGLLRQYIAHLLVVGLIWANLRPEIRKNRHFPFKNATNVPESINFFWGSTGGLKSGDSSYEYSQRSEVWRLQLRILARSEVWRLQLRIRLGVERTDFQWMHDQGGDQHANTGGHKC